MIITIRGIGFLIFGILYRIWIIWYRKNLISKDTESIPKDKGYNEYKSKIIGETILSDLIMPKKSYVPIAEYYDSKNNKRYDYELFHYRTKRIHWYNGQPIKIYVSESDEIVYAPELIKLDLLKFMVIINDITLISAIIRITLDLINK